MFSASQQHHVAQIIATLDREEIIRQLRSCNTRFPIDFTDDWLHAQRIEDLRHVFTAVCLQCDITPRPHHACAGGHAA